MHWQYFLARSKAGDRSYIPASQVSPPSGEQLASHLASMDKVQQRMLLAICLTTSAGDMAIPDLMGQDPELMGLCKDAISWTELPLLLYENDRAVITVALLGLLKSREVRIEADWLRDDAYQTAFSLLSESASATGNGFVLLDRTCRGNSISGRSLGLPLAVAASRLTNGQAMPEGLFLTGRVDGTGRVEAVDFVAAKNTAVADLKNISKKLFVYPSACHFESGKDSSCPAIKVETVGDAISVVEMFDCDLTSGMGITGMLAQWRNQPWQFFAWIANEDCEHAVIDVMARQALAENWAANFDGNHLLLAAHSLYQCCRGNLREEKKLLRSLLDLFTWEQVQSVGMPDTTDRLIDLLHLCDMKITDANHSGRSCHEWRELSRQCSGQIEDCSNNHDLDLIMAHMRGRISDWHNGYYFDQAYLKSNFVKDVSDRINARLGSGKKENDLAKCCGFLCHHMAFAGKFQDALAMANNSISLFTDLKDKKRRFIDKAYIYLELGDSTKALHEICLALDATESTLPAKLFDITDDRIRNDAYAHAVFARFCAVAPDLFADYPAWDILTKIRSGEEHPWQLWAYNCGSLLLNSAPAQAVEFFDTSVDICMKYKQHTLVPMALLGLSVLKNIQPPALGTILLKTRHVIERMRVYCDNGTLNPEHFAGLLKAENELAVLETVERSKASLFPFNYR